MMGDNGVDVIRMIAKQLAERPRLYIDRLDDDPIEVEHNGLQTPHRLDARLFRRSRRLVVDLFETPQQALSHVDVMRLNQLAADFGRE